MKCPPQSTNCTNYPGNFDPTSAEDGDPDIAVARTKSIESDGNFYDSFKDVDLKEAQLWEGSSIDHIHRDLAPIFRRHTERIARDMLTIKNNDVLMNVSKADLMYTRLVWRRIGKENIGPAGMLYKSARDIMRERFRCWENGEHDKLLHDLRMYDEQNLLKLNKKRDVESSLELRQQQCAALVRDGEFSKATQALKNVSKWNGDVDKYLLPLFPQRHETLDPVPMHAPLPNVSKWDWHRAICDAKRDTPPAASGKRLGHYAQCDIKPSNDPDDPLEKSDPWHYRRQVCVLQAAGQFDWGEHSEIMYETAFATSLTVLEKNPDKPESSKPRPIGAGASPDRKLGNVCLNRAAHGDIKKVVISIRNLCHGAKVLGMPSHIIYVRVKSRLS